MIGVGVGYLVLLVVEQILTASGHSHSHGKAPRLEPLFWQRLKGSPLHQERPCKSTTWTCVANSRKPTCVISISPQAVLMGSLLIIPEQAHSHNHRHGGDGNGALSESFSTVALVALALHCLVRHIGDHARSRTCLIHVAQVDGFIMAGAYEASAQIGARGTPERFHARCSLDIRPHALDHSRPPLP